MLVLLEELDAERANSTNRPDLVDHAGGKLRSSLVSDNDRGPNRQLPIDLDGSPMLVEADGFRADRERSSLKVLSRQSHGRTERHPGTAAFGRGIERDVERSDAVLG